MGVYKGTSNKTRVFTIFFLKKIRVTTNTPNDLIYADLSHIIHFWFIILPLEETKYI